jgi:hypothetical protein
VAKEGGRSLGLVERRDRTLQVLVLAELEHRRESTADEDRVELVQIEVAELGRVFEQGDQLGCVQKAHRDQVIGRPLRLVARI